MDPSESLEIVNVVGVADLGCELALNAVTIDLPGSDYDPTQMPAIKHHVETDGTTTVLIWESGKITCTGARSADEAEEALQQVRGTLDELGAPVTDSINVSIANMVVTADLFDSLSLEAVAIGLGLENIEYDSDEFPGLFYTDPESDTSCIIFDSGKVNILGVQTLAAAERALARLEERLDKFETNPAVIPSDPAEQLSLIDEYCEALSVPPEVRSSAHDILRSGSDAGVGQGRKDSIQAASALYLACRMADHDLTQDRFAAVAGVSTVSIRNLYSSYEDITAASESGTETEQPSTEGTAEDATDNGVEPSEAQATVPLPTSPDRDELLDAIQRVGELVDARPIQSDILEHTTASIADFEEVFGSWTAAVEAAGYEVSRGRRETITRGDVIEHIRELARDLEKRPTMTDLNERREMSTTPVYKYFDGWDDALEAAGVADGPPVDT